MTLPPVQSLRPGVELNGERVTKVHMQNDTMAVTGHPATVPRASHCKKRPFSARLKAIIRSWHPGCICQSLAV